MKLFLNVSKEEQRERFLARIGEPDKQLEVLRRATRASGATGTTTSGRSRTCSPTRPADWAPWHVIPADRKWFMRLGAAAVIIEALMQLDPQYPTASAEAMADMAAAKAELLAEGPLREGVVIAGINDGPAAAGDAAGDRTRDARRAAAKGKGKKAKG